MSPIENDKKKLMNPPTSVGQQRITFLMATTNKRKIVFLLTSSFLRAWVKQFFIFYNDIHMNANFRFFTYGKSVSLVAS